jgi:large subunit ribosomal protein L29
MKTQELRDIEDDTLREYLATARRDLFGLRMQHATGELENTAGLKTAKRNLARALTVARQRGVDPEPTHAGETAGRDRNARSAGGRGNG